MSAIAWKETRFLKVPLDQDEIRARGEQLADLIARQDVLLVGHKAEKDAMKDAESRLDAQIHKLATVVNERVEERSVSVEMRVDLNLRMVEEVRLDTGEIVVTRNVTEQDKIRAATMMQTEIPGTTPPKDEPRA